MTTTTTTTKTMVGGSLENHKEMWLHSQHPAPSKSLLLCQASVGTGQNQKTLFVILPSSTDSQPAFCPRSYISKMEKSKE